MLETTWKTGYICTICGQETTYTIKGFWRQFIAGYMMEKVLQALNKRGGTFKAPPCRHEFRVIPGSRRKP